MQRFGAGMGNMILRQAIGMATDPGNLPLYVKNAFL
jgi:hypothetical protein